MLIPVAQNRCVDAGRRSVEKKQRRIGFRPVPQETSPTRTATQSSAKPCPISRSPCLSIRSPAPGWVAAGPLCPLPPPGGQRPPSLVQIKPSTDRSQTRLCCGTSRAQRWLSSCDTFAAGPNGRVASSAVEHSAFNRLVLSSNLRRPIPCDPLGLQLPFPSGRGVPFAQLIRLEPEAIHLSQANPTRGIGFCREGNDGRARPLEGISTSG